MYYENLDQLDLGILTENTELFALSVNFGLLLVWVVYLQIFLISYLRQRRASVLISRGAGVGIDARCLVGNMSAEPIYIQTIVARIATGRRETFVTLTDRRAAEQGEQLDIARLSMQGPLLSGRYMEVESFRDIFTRLSLRRGADDSGPPAELGEDEPVTNIEIVVLAFYGIDDLLIAARRTFAIRHTQEGPELRPTTLGTRQIRSRRARRRLERKWRSILLS